MKQRVINALKKRRNIGDEFRTIIGYGWDYLMAFKVFDEYEAPTDVQVQFNMRFILAHLASGGLETRLFYSVSVILIL